MPARYDLEIEPRIQEGRFHGRETVTLDVVEEVAELVCNAAELDVSNVVLRDDAGERTVDLHVDEESERLVLRLPGPLPLGRYRLDITYTGTLNDKLRGFYRSSFTAPDGTTQQMAVSQFEAADARRAFPCWDEPDRKAVFGVSIVVPDGMTAVSNGVVVSETALGADRRRVVFADTIPMSTYLVALVVGPLERSRTVSVDGVDVTVLHVPGKGHLAEFALEAAEHALRYFTDWFAIPYPGTKLDLIAVPDFAFGAMENLGAVTFRESVLLVDPAAASRSETERVATVVSHEIAHMWFGDLVTMKWWNGLWLNEAFATLMEVMCADHFRPEWEMWSGFSRERDDAMAVDGLAATRAIEHAVRTPREAEDMFDRLTYEKGGAVLRMLECYLGEERFRDGIRSYLANHLYGNADTTDLWDAIERAVGEPVRSVMDSWIFQGGHPIVTVEAEGTSLRLRQQPFEYPSPAADDVPGERGTSWWVPMRIRTIGTDSAPSDGATGHRERKLLVGPDGATIDMGGELEAVVANAGGTGVYRIRYEGALGSAVRSAVGRMDEVERLVLLSDSWAQVLAGMSPLAEWVEVVRGMGVTEEPHVWGSVVRSLDVLDHVANDSTRPALASFARSVLRPVLDRVGLAPRPADGPLVAGLRGQLVDALGTIGDDDAVVEWSLDRLEESLHGEWHVQADLIRPVLSCAARDGDEDRYELYLDRYRKAGTPQEEIRYLFTLPRFGNESLVERTLRLADTEVRTQNAPFVLALCIASRHGGIRAWEYVASRWQQLIDKLPTSGLGHVLSGLESQADPALAAAVRDFLATHDAPSNERRATLSLQRLEVNAVLAQREGPALAATLS